MFVHCLDALSVGWVGSIIGISGLLLTIVVYFKTKKCSRLAFQSSEIAIIGGSDATFPHELGISFGGIPVSQVTSSRIIIWNDGDTTITGNQIVSDDKLRFELNNEGKILKVTIQKVTRAVNKIYIKSNDETCQTANIEFDFLDPNDGVFVEVLHSGDKEDLKLLGTLRGLPQGITYYGRIIDIGRKKKHKNIIFFPNSIKTVYWMMIVAGILMISGGIICANIPPHILDKINSTSPKNPWVMFVFPGLLYLILPSFMLWRFRRRYPQILDISNKVVNREKNT